MTWVTIQVYVEVGLRVGVEVGGEGGGGEESEVEGGERGHEHGRDVHVSLRTEACQGAGPGALLLEAHYLGNPQCFLITF